MALPMNKFILPLLLGLSGCATLSPTAKTKIDEAAAAGSELVCEGPACTEAWSRAQFWIHQHSRMKLQVATDTVLETYNPAGIVAYGFSIAKEPLGENKFRITVRLVCGNMFGCTPPSPTEAQNAFFHYLKTGQDVLKEAGGPFVGLQ